jgi:ATP phosphoribosyltransferase
LKGIIPSLKSPTVVPLAEEGMVALHSVIPEDVFWDVMEKLKKAGASDIIVVPIETIIK